MMLEKYEICCGLFHGFDWSAWMTGTASAEAGAAAERARAHPQAGGREEPSTKGSHRSIEGVCACGAAR